MKPESANQFVRRESFKRGLRACGSHHDLGGPVHGRRVRDGDRARVRSGDLGNGGQCAVLGSHARQGDQGEGAPRELLLQPPHSIPGEIFAGHFIRNFYTMAVTKNVLILARPISLQERKQRQKRLEDSLRDENMSEEQRAEKRHAHAVRETEFLRLKRSRLGVDDFDPLQSDRSRRVRGGPSGAEM